MLIILASLALTAWSYSGLKDKPLELSIQEKKSHELLYLPEGGNIKLLDFGYTNILSDIMLFNTINYFGKHHRTDQKYPLFFHLCSVTTKLDQFAPKISEFCANMLAWEANEPENSIKILSETIKSRPDDWILYYLRGSVYMTFLSDTFHAKENFVKSSKLKGAPPIIARLAAKSLIELNQPSTAVDFLTEMLKRAQSQVEKEALTARLKEAKNELYISILEKAVTEFNRRHNQAPTKIAQLIDSGILRAVPGDPFGGEYIIDQNTGTITSTSGTKRLRGLKVEENIAKRTFEEYE